MDFLWLFVKYFFLVEDNTWTKCGKHVASDNILFALGSGRTMAPSTSLVKKKRDEQTNDVASLLPTVRNFTLQTYISSNYAK